jgi:hypothetical protein
MFPFWLFGPLPWAHDPYFGYPPNTHIGDLGYVGAGIIYQPSYHFKRAFFGNFFFFFEHNNLLHYWKIDPKGLHKSKIPDTRTKQ